MAPWRSLPSSMDSDVPSVDTHNGAVQAHGGRQIDVHDGDAIPSLDVHGGAIQAHGGRRIHTHDECGG